MTAERVQADCRFSLKPYPEQVRVARRRVAEFCARSGVADADGPVLAVSELFTNAIEFAIAVGGYVTVTVVVNGSVVMVEVEDPVPQIRIELKAIGLPSAEAENGRGLVITRALADKLEVTVGKHRKSICATFEQESAA